MYDVVTIHVMSVAYEVEMLLLIIAEHLSARLMIVHSALAMGIYICP